LRNQIIAVSANRGFSQIKLLVKQAVTGPENLALCNIAWRCHLANRLNGMILSDDAMR